MQTSHQSLVALCPSCEAPFHYRQCMFQIENDAGGWMVTCSDCEQPFKFQLFNPRESSTNERWRVTEIETWPGDNNVPIAADIVMHNRPSGKLNLQFKVGAPSLYRCERTDADLDGAAYIALNIERDRLEQAWRNAENYLLSAGTGSGSSDRILVQLDVPCSCGVSHVATFSARMHLGASAQPLADRCLLVHVDGANLEERLNCLASKNDAMDLLEKLLIRWHVTADQIVLASPFVGHQFMKPEDVLAVWNWLFCNVDPKQVTVISRRATWTKFKEVHDANDVPFTELARYGLEAKVVSGGLAKQDFHAKFFAGISGSAVEVLSGSANLLRGPSIENISFRRMSPKRFKTKYLDVLNKQVPWEGKKYKVGDTLKLVDGKWTNTVLRAAPWE